MENAVDPSVGKVKDDEPPSTTTVDRRPGTLSGSMIVTIFHHAACSKSNCALDLLHANGTDHRVVDYLAQPPTVEELTALLAKLRIPAEQLVRRSEDLYKQRFEGRDLDEQGWIQAMHEHPILIERPIVVKGGQGRDRPAHRTCSGTHQQTVRAQELAPHQPWNTASRKTPWAR